MPIRADDPLRKITFNSYEEDYQWLIKNYGPGWTERLRQHIHNEVQQRKPTHEYTKRYDEFMLKRHKRTLGDLQNE